MAKNLKSSGSSSNLLKIKNRPITIEKYVENVFIDFLKSRQRRFASVNEIHATDLYGFCPRRYRLALELDKTPKKKPGTHTPSLSLTYHIGEAIEDILRMALEHGATLIAKWTCKKCGNSWIGLKRACARCQNEDVEHSQLTLKVEHGDFVIVGHPDFVIADDTGAYVLECKSMGFSEHNPMWNYDLLKKPLIEHEYQVHAYMWLASKLGNRPLVITGESGSYSLSSTLAAIAYIPKLHHTTPIKVFSIRRNKVIWKEIKRDMKLLIEKELPPRKCKSINSYLAVQFCPKHIKKRCWDGM